MILSVVQCGRRDARLNKQSSSSNYKLVDDTNDFEKRENQLSNLLD